MSDEVSEEVTLSQALKEAATACAQSAKASTVPGNAGSYASAAKLLTEAYLDARRVTGEG